MAREDFLEYCASYSGIDGGDIGAEYWFMGMEWSNIDDIKDDYDEKTKTWIERPFPEKEVKIKENAEKWELENKLDIIYKLMYKNSTQKTIFEKGTNTLKLNLLPLPFSKSDKKTHNNEWIKYEYAEKTGFESFKSYMEAVIPARQRLFQELLKEGKKAKTIFCFGKGYEDGFIWALAGNRKLKAREDAPQLDQKTVSGYNTKIEVYDINTSDIKRILICPFPYLYPYKKENEFTNNDWQTICDLAKE